jgi:hypothetical protein
VKHAITVIDQEHRERHGKGGACNGHAGFERERSDSTGESLPVRIDARRGAAVRFDWVSGWLWTASIAIIFFLPSLLSRRLR